MGDAAVGKGQVQVRQLYFTVVKPGEWANAIPTTTNHVALFPTLGKSKVLAPLKWNGEAVPWENHLRDHGVSATR